jgi:hypothetical protein
LIQGSVVYANNVFEQPWWLDIVAPNSWTEAVSKNKNGEVQARIAYAHNQKAVFMPNFTQTSGIWMDQKLKDDYGRQKTVLYELFEQINSYKNITLHLAPDNEYVLPFRWMGYHLAPRFTYRLYDLHDCDALYTGFNKTAKKNIKYARNKVSIRFETDVDALLSLLDKTFAAQSRKNPMQKEVIKGIVETCDRNGSGQYIDARDADGNIHSCAYFIYDKNVWYYLLGASDPEYRSSGAQSLVIWEGIQMASKYSKIFDFEGSMIEGIENFFRQFGGRCVPYFEIRKNSVINDIMISMKPRIKKLIGYKD